MAMVVPDVGEVVMLSDLLGNGEDWTLKLFTNDVTPAESDTDATYTEATFTGYSSKTLTRAVGAGNWGTPSTSSGTTSSVYNSGTPQEWNAESAQTIYGYFCVGAVSAVLRLAERFASAVGLLNGSTLQLTPRIELG